jgi:iron(II)-dependent oxidoreductase
MLGGWIRDARQRTFELTADLSEAELLGARLPIVNPPLWEIGHVAWFQERWVLRHARGRAPIRADGDALYDSAAVAHDTRWDLPLPPREETLRYLARVRDDVLELLEEREPTPEEAYFIRLAVFHEDMHDEALTYTRQTLGLKAPRFGVAPEPAAGGAGAVAGDAEIAGGEMCLGAVPREEPFVFDNEKWAHPVRLEPFAIARAAVSQREFLEFVEEAGYRRPELWSSAGLQWLRRTGAEHPVYWRRENGSWERRHFDRWVPLEPHRAVVHVSWYEAEAYCRYRGRRLPTEAEWEAAATDLGRRRRFPWGDAEPDPARANLEWRSSGCVDVGAHPLGDSPAGCRQMIGNVWEWTQNDFLPYPGFAADPYQEYSEPWFGTHKVLRGGCWVTRGRLLRNTWRNFYTPDRRDVWAGFRTCAR